MGTNINKRTARGGDTQKSINTAVFICIPPEYLRRNFSQIKQLFQKDYRLQSRILKADIVVTSKYFKHHCELTHRIDRKL